MKKVEIEFSNIQSHQFTQFELDSGINLILANKNNVGKSTIFEVIMCIAAMPKVQPDKLDGLLRGGTSQGYASFKFVDSEDYDLKVVFWLFKEQSDEHVRAFFETIDATNEHVRSRQCPKELINALDIVIGPNGEMMNCNSADTVQLIAQDSEQNDMVVSSVLIDYTVEHIRENMIALRKQCTRDQRDTNIRLENGLYALEGCSYNMNVDNFFAERELLTAACSIMDAGLSNLSIQDIAWERDSARPSSPALYYLLELLSTLDKSIQGISESTESSQVAEHLNTWDAWKTLKNALSLLELLSKVNLTATSTQAKIREQNLQSPINLKRLLSTSQTLVNACISAEQCRAESMALSNLAQERAAIEKSLSSNCNKVQCPVRGTVYYGEQTCIPISD